MRNPVAYPRAVAALRAPPVHRRAPVEAAAAGESVLGLVVGGDKSFATSFRKHVEALDHMEKKVKPPKEERETKKKIKLEMPSPTEPEESNRGSKELKVALEAARSPENASRLKSFLANKAARWVCLAPLGIFTPACGNAQVAIESLTQFESELSQYPRFFFLLGFLYLRLEEYSLVSFRFKRSPLHQTKTDQLFPGLVGVEKVSRAGQDATLW